MTSLERARRQVPLENPDLPMALKFDVSSQETIDRSLSVADLTFDTDSTQRHIVGVIHDRIHAKLREAHFPNITVIRGNPIVSAEDNFDNLLFSPGNPGRASTYTRYVDEDRVLRTHTSALIPRTFREHRRAEPTTFVLPGLVYRRDVIDPRHLDVFHQVDVWTLQRSDTHGTPGRKELLNLVHAVFDAACPDAEMIVHEAIHPYTKDGIEVYAKVDGQEIEVLEAGLIHPGVLRKAGLDPDIYCGLALGMGIERLIMARKMLPDIRLIRSNDPRVMRQMTNMDRFVPVSNQPAITRDLSYCIDSHDTEEDVCDAIRVAFGRDSDLLEQVEILERTSFAKLNPIAREKLGAREGQDNVLVRITLRHPDRTLTKQDAAALYAAAYPLIHQGAIAGYVQ